MYHVDQHEERPPPPPLTTLPPSLVLLLFLLLFLLLHVPDTVVARSVIVHAATAPSANAGFPSAATLDASAIPAAAAAT